MGSIAATTFIRNIRFNLTESIGANDLTDGNAGSQWTNTEILEALNKAKDRCWDLIREVREDYFETTGATLSFVTTSKEYSLASGFRQLVGIKITTSGYESIRFRRVEQSQKEFQQRDALPSSTGSGYNELIYDIIGNSKIKLADFPPAAMTATYDYIGVLADFTLAANSTVDINDELREYMEAYATMILFGKQPTDKRLALYADQVKEGGRLEKKIIKSVARRNIRESKKVAPYNP